VASRGRETDGLRFRDGRQRQKPDDANAEKHPLRLSYMHFSPPVHVSQFPVRFFVLPTSDQLLSPPPGRQSRSAEIVLEIRQGLPRLPQLLCFHELPHLHLHGNGSPGRQAQETPATNKHGLDTSLPGTLLRFAEAGASFGEASPPDSFQLCLPLFGPILLLASNSRPFSGGLFW
jgi:hypothetical protein